MFEGWGVEVIRTRRAAGSLAGALGPMNRS